MSRPIKEILSDTIDKCTCEMCQDKRDEWIKEIVSAIDEVPVLNHACFVGEPNTFGQLVARDMKARIIKKLLSGK